MIYLAASSGNILDYNAITFPQGMKWKISASKYKSPWNPTWITRKSHVNKSHYITIDLQMASHIRLCLWFFLQVLIQILADFVFLGCAVPYLLGECIPAQAWPTYAWNEYQTGLYSPLIFSVSLSVTFSVTSLRCISHVSVISHYLLNEDYSLVGCSVNQWQLITETCEIQRREITEEVTERLTDNINGEYKPV